MPRITEENFEQVLHRLKKSSVINLQEIAFIDPYGMVALLEIGEIYKPKANRKILYLPESEEVLKYLERMDFFKIAPKYFIFEPSKPKISEKYLRSSYSDVLTRHLKYDERTINGFIVSLSEVCQNIIEHSKTKGFVGIQKYHFQNLGKNVVKIAVMDTGIGFRKSLSERFSLKSDLHSIEEALIHGASRYTDKGRGHGLAAVRRFVNEWNGKISIRSGTAKLSIIPEWAWGKEKEYNLTHFPGAQINILLPEI
ncbi:MAG: sensor histidine kinase [Deltaproteobacteria bacterium]|nr:sensor histidine kinase [Deltaproteobacteria bacterium]